MVCFACMTLHVKYFKYISSDLYYVKKYLFSVCTRIVTVEPFLCLCVEHFLCFVHHRQYDDCVCTCVEQQIQYVFATIHIFIPLNV